MEIDLIHNILWYKKYYSINGIVEKGYRHNNNIFHVHYNINYFEFHE